MQISRKVSSVCALCACKGMRSWMHTKAIALPQIYRYFVIVVQMAGALPAMCVVGRAVKVNNTYHAFFSE
jgi:hypothetical protein